MENKGFSNRKVFLINPKFQLTFMAYMGGLAVATLVIFLGSIMYFFADWKDMGRALGLPADHVFFQFMAEQQAHMFKVFGFTSLGILLAVAGIGLWVSHRVAGPLYRLRKHMNAVAQGKKVGEVSFRKRDFFPELAEEYNHQYAYLKKGTKRPVDKAA